ncbi:MAG: hypothetical protein FWC41_12865, partial [Firmicutes bacterium]|nr:hypothetical protein [Bacillota bacterium]
MIESKLIIDLFGIGFEIYLVMLFYGTFLQLKVIKKRFLVLGFISLASINFVKFLILDVPILFVLLSMFIIFMYGFFYVKSLSTWILFAFLLSALFFVSELVVAIIQTNVLGLPIENIQNMWLSYAIGMLCAKLFTLVLIYLIRLFVPLKKGAINNKWFNLLLLFLPLQSLMLCFLVLELSFTTDNYSAIFIGEIAVIISLVLIFATMYIIHNQLKAMAYKKEYEFAKQRWKTQIEHYDELYDTQKEIRSIRHDMNSTLLALSGLIEKGKTDEALKKINNTQKIIHKTDSVIDSGLPAIDAIMNAFVKKANDF